MDFTDSQFLQVIIGLTIGLLLFIGAYVLSEKTAVSILVASVPFEPITSGYGTLNMVVVYMVGLVFLLRGRFKKFPLMMSAMFIVLALLMSTSQAHRSTYGDHFFYILSAGANFVLFYIVYNYFVQKRTDPAFATKLFLFTGALVLLLSLAKLVFNFDPGIALGISELELASNRSDNQRFIGSFNAAGINGAFHASQLIICAFALIVNRRGSTRLLLVMLFLGNAAFLVATGSRGGFIGAVFGLVLLLAIFVRQIGLGRALTLGLALPVLFASASFVMIKFTDHNVLFERLLATEMKGFTPDTRDFSYAIERIPDELAFGHGPRLKLNNQHLRNIPGYTAIGYPHNLYLHILYTTGVVGLIAYLTWFLMLISRFLRATRFRSDSAMLNGVPRLALAITAAFLVDELKIEFLRFSLFDYQLYMFALWGMFLALSDRAFEEGREAYRTARLERLA